MEKQQKSTYPKMGLSQYNIPSPEAGPSEGGLFLLVLHLPWFLSIQNPNWVSTKRIKESIYRETNKRKREKKDPCRNFC